jgi:hypothetical protein
MAFISPNCGWQYVKTYRGKRVKPPYFLDILIQSYCQFKFRIDRVQPLGAEFSKPGGFKTGRSNELDEGV